MIEITQEQFDRMMRAVRFVESMQRGPVRGQEIPEQPANPPAAEVFIKVTGPEDEAFKPEDEDSKYFPCVLTEKVVLSTEDEAIYGPLDSYWRDLDGGEDEEGRAFALNGGDLVEGQRYKATVVEMHDGQYPVLAVSDPGGSGVSEHSLVETDTSATPPSGYLSAKKYTFDPATGTRTYGDSIWLKNDGL